MQVEGRFFKGVGAVGKHNAAHVFVLKGLSAVAPKFGPVAGAHVLAGQVAALAAGNTRHPFDAGQTFQHALHGQYAGLVAYLLQGGVGHPGNGASRAQQGDLGQGVLGQRVLGQDAGFRTIGIHT